MGVSLDLTMERRLLENLVGRIVEGKPHLTDWIEFWASHVALDYGILHDTAYSLVKEFHDQYCELALQIGQATRLAIVGALMWDAYHRGEEEES